jgi:protein TonB
VGSAYNRTSLAVDVQGDGALAWKPMPQLVPRPAVGPSRAQMFVSLDDATARKNGKSKAISFVLHTVIIGLVLWWGVASHVIVHPQSTVVPIKFALTDPPPPIMHVAKIDGGGGAGGVHKVAPLPIKAPEPKPAPRVHLLPPQIVELQHPKLPEAPTSQVNMQVNTNMPAIGMSNSPQIALASQGPGAQAGMGMGMGGGFGIGHGNGTGMGSGGGYGGGVMSVGGGVSAPIVIHSVEPEFTEQARRSDYQGTVGIQLIVDAQGNPQAAHVVHHLGMGLDEKALEAVRQYRFKPAMYQGHPVAVQLVIDVDFRLH